MRKLTLLLFLVLVIASATYAADVDVTLLNATCDREGRAMFYFNIVFDEPFNTDELMIKDVSADWYDCVKAGCTYSFSNFELEGQTPIDIINSARKYVLVTPALTFRYEDTYNLDFIYPTVVYGGEGYEHETIEIDLDCPGYDFSCELYDFELDRCSSGDGTFRMDFTAKGINQPHKIDLINDFRYHIIGENSEVTDIGPLTSAPIKYREEVSIKPELANVVSLSNDRYYISFPYSDIAKWVAVKGAYCNNDRNRFGKTTTYQFLATKKCVAKEFVVTVVDDEPEPEPEPEPAKTSIFHPVPPPKPAAQPEPTPKPTTQTKKTEEKPMTEVTLISIIRALMDFFKG
jgi:hypothetical protein